MAGISKRFLVTVLLACVVPGVSESPKLERWQPLATIQAIVEQKSLGIEQTAFAKTGDKVYISGRFNSDKPPALPSWEHWRIGRFTQPAPTSTKV